MKTNLHLNFRRRLVAPLCSSNKIWAIRHSGARARLTPNQMDLWLHVPFVGLFTFTPAHLLPLLQSLCSNPFQLVSGKTTWTLMVTSLSIIACACTWFRVIHVWLVVAIRKQGPNLLTRYFRPPEHTVMWWIFFRKHFTHKEHPSNHSLLKWESSRPPGHFNFSRIIIPPYFKSLPIIDLLPHMYAHLCPPSTKPIGSKKKT